MFSSRTLVLLLVFTLTSLNVQAQTLYRVDLIAKRELLYLDRNTIEKMLSEGSFSVLDEGDRQTFLKYSENIHVDYSSGNCSDVAIDESDWIDGFLGPDIWEVPAGNVVRISIEPKEQFRVRDLGINLSKLKKERLYRIYNDYFIYFNKDDGIAIKAWNDQVESIALFPRREDRDKLCSDPKISQHFFSNKWRIIPEKNKEYCVLFNKPANVRNVVVVPDAGNSKFEISVTADDPENDVLAFICSVSAGEIVSNGAKATWSLTGVEPGTYEIKVAVDDGSGPRGRWISKTVTIK